MKILLVEGDYSFSSWLAARLGEAGYLTLCTPLHPAVFRSDIARQVAITIIDVDRDGHAPSHAVRRAREAGHDVPLLVISGRESWREKVECLDAGADDFLVKPVRSEEVVARLRALVRRAAGKMNDRLRMGALEVDLRSRSAWLEGGLLDLTRNEFRLLRHLMLRPDKLHTADELRELIGQPGQAPSANAVEVLVARLRRKIGRSAVRTVRGIGYRLSPPASTCEDAVRPKALAGEMRLTG